MDVTKYEGRTLQAKQLARRKETGNIYLSRLQYKVQVKKPIAMASR